MIHSARAENEAVDLKKFDVAPFSGTLISPGMAKKAIDAKIERDGLKKENESLNISIGLYKANEKLYQESNNALLNQNVNLIKANNEARETSNWTKAAYFIGGIAISGLAVYGASKLVK